MGRFQTQINLAFDFYQFYGLEFYLHFDVFSSQDMLIGTDFWLKHPLEHGGIDG